MELFTELYWSLKLSLVLFFCLRSSKLGPRLARVVNLPEPCLFSILTLLRGEGLSLACFKVVILSSEI